MSKISKWEDVVERILENNIKAREDDRYLFLCVLHLEGFDPTQISLQSYLENGMGCQNTGNGIEIKPFPNYDTITRVRRKLQEKRPNLLPPKKIKKMRADAEEDFIEYARSHV